MDNKAGTICNDIEFGKWSEPKRIEYLGFLTLMAAGTLTHLNALCRQMVLGYEIANLDDEAAQKEARSVSAQMISDTSEQIKTNLHVLADVTGSEELTTLAERTHTVVESWVAYKAGKNGKQ